MRWDCRSWEAWHDRMPGSTPTLHVIGECTMPTPGYGCDLRVHDPQGADPADLLLDLVVTEPTGPEPDVLDPCRIHFRLPTDARYETVSIVDVAGGIPVLETS